MTRPRNTRNDIIPIPAVHGVHVPGAVEAQEAAGAAAMAAGDSAVIPTEISGGTEADLTALGFVLGEIDPNDRLFREATLPPGWTRAGTGHSLHTDIVDELGRKRIGIFYKAAYYDRRADLSITTMYGYLRSCLYDDTTPVLDDTWATRETVLAELEKLRRYEQDRMDLWSGQPEPYAAEYVQEARAELVKIGALRATLGGDAP